MRRLVTIVLVVLAFVTTGLVVVLGLGVPYLASSVVLPRVERRLQAEVRYEAIRPGLGSLVIEGVTVRLPSVPEAEISVGSVRVRYEVAPLLLGRVEVGGVELVGPRLVLEAAGADTFRRLGAHARSVRGRGERAGQVGRRGGARDLSARQGSIVIRDARGPTISVEGLGARLEGSGPFELATGRLSVSARPEGPEVISAGGARVTGDLSSGASIHEAELDSPVVRLAFGGEGLRELRELGRAVGRMASEVRGERVDGARPGDEPTEDRAEGLLLGLTTRVARGRLDLHRSGAESPLLSLVDLEGQLFAGSLAEPPTLQLAGRADPGGGTVRFGVTMSDGQPTARLDMASFRLGELAEDLSRRGVAFDRASVVDADLWLGLTDGSLAFRGEVSTDRLSASGRLLSDRPLEGLRLRLVGAGSFPLSGDAIAIEDARIWLNGVEVQLAGSAERRGEDYVLDLTAALQPIGCAALFEATPEPLRANLDGLALEGVLSGTFRLAVDSRRLVDTVLEVDLANGCRAAGSRELAISRLQGPFTHRVMVPGPIAGELREMEITTGPGSAEWAALSQISPYMVAAVLTTEDGRFWSHRGFSLTEIRRALIRDLAAGWAQFGASTITMQLARNLYLFRGRTLARKLQEAVLTWYLESQLTKEQILALYLNVIEFGPGIYGVRAAAMHYFGRMPDDLSPREAVFLAKLLPNPVRRHGSTYGRGELSPRWETMLDRTLAVMRERRHISREEYEAAVAERIVFHAEGEPLPSHRVWSASRRTFRDGFDVVLDPWVGTENGGEPTDNGAGGARLPAPAELADE